MQDKTIDNVLRHLHRECMNGRHGGLQCVLGLIRIRGVEPDFQRYAAKRGPRSQQRAARAQTRR